MFYFMQAELMKSLTTYFFEILTTPFSLVRKRNNSATCSYNIEMKYFFTSCASNSSIRWRKLIILQTDNMIWEFIRCPTIILLLVIHQDVLPADPGCHANFILI